MKKLSLWLALICLIQSCTAPKHGCKSTWNMSGYGFAPTPTQLEHQNVYGYMYCPQTGRVVITLPPTGQIIASYFIKN